MNIHVGNETELGNLDWSSFKEWKEVVQVEEVVVLSEDHQYDQKVVEAKQKESSMMKHYYVSERG